MAIITGIALGVSVLDGYTGYPSPHVYSGIKVYGESIVDHIHIKNILTDTTVIDALQLYVQPVWDGNTIFLANFANTLNGGNITSVINPITSWTVLRKKATETKYTILATLPSTATQYVDPTAEPNVTYTYQVLASNATEISEPLTNTLDSNFFNCILTDLTGSTTYLFDLNLDFSGYENETAHQRYDGYNKYSAHGFGARDFKTGDVSAILASNYSADGIIQTVDYIKNFNTFINNGQSKYFKDRKGNVLKVVTTGGVKQAPLQVGISAQPYVISFHFEEVGEVNG